MRQTASISCMISTVWGEESEFRFDLRENMKNGRSFKDAICPDSMEFKKDHFIMGGKYGRVLFLKEYASYIKDSMINELTSLNRSLMLSIDIILFLPMRRCGRCRTACWVWRPM